MDKNVRATEFQFTSMLNDCSKMKQFYMTLKAKTTRKVRENFKT